MFEEMRKQMMQAGGIGKKNGGTVVDPFVVMKKKGRRW